MLNTVKDAATRLIPGLASRPMATASGPLDIPIPDIIDLGAPIKTLEPIHRRDGGPGAALKAPGAAPTFTHRSLRAGAR